MSTKTQIWCPIHRDWFELVGGTIIPPDVQAQVSSCGHNLPTNTYIREIEVNAIQDWELD